MDMHVEQRFQGHRTRYRGGVASRGQACHVVVATRGWQPWFSSFHVACEAVRGFRQPAARGDAALLAWVLMPDHAHWLLQPGGPGTLAAVVSRMKATTGAQVNRMLARAGPLWQPGFDCQVLAADQDLRVASYQFVAQSLSAGRLGDFGDYPFWDCAWM